MPGSCSDLKSFWEDFYQAAALNYAPDRIRTGACILSHTRIRFDKITKERHELGEMRMVLYTREQDQAYAVYFIPLKAAFDYPIRVLVLEDRAGFQEFLALTARKHCHSSAGGSWVTSLAVATTNTGAVFSCIQEMNEPNTRADAPPSVAPELLLPAMPFSISSSQRTQGAMASAVWITDRRFDSLWPTMPA